MKHPEGHTEAMRILSRHLRINPPRIPIHIKLSLHTFYTKLGQYTSRWLKVIQMACHTDTLWLRLFNTDRSLCSTLFIQQSANQTCYKLNQEERTH